MNDYIVDTNVWAAAAGYAECDEACMLACLEFLEMLRETSASIVIDCEETPPGNSVLGELKRNLREGDYAHDLLWRHFFNRGLIKPIALQYDDEGAVIPGGITIRQVEPDGSLSPFDPSDRKWIALYVTHGATPPIHNATDSDWEKARVDLTANNVKVHQLCTCNHI